MDVHAARVCGAWRGTTLMPVSVCGPKPQRVAAEGARARAVPVSPA